MKTEIKLVIIGDVIYIDLLEILSLTLARDICWETFYFESSGYGGIKWKIDTYREIEIIDTRKGIGIPSTMKKMTLNKWKDPGFDIYKVLDSNGRKGLVKKIYRATKDNIKKQEMLSLKNIERKIIIGNLQNKNL